MSKWEWNVLTLCSQVPSANTAMRGTAKCHACQRDAKKGKSTIIFFLMNCYIFNVTKKETNIITDLQPTKKPKEVAN